MAEWLMISELAMNKVKAANRQNQASHRGNDVSALQIHRKIALDSAKRLILSPLSSLMTIVVIAVSLLLPALLFGLNENLQSILLEFQNSARITLFLDNSVSESQGQKVSDDLLTDNTIQSAIYVSATKALEEFSLSSGLGEVLRSLSSNPLPAAVIITPATLNTREVNALSQRLETISEVDFIQLDSQWINRLSALSDLISIVGQLLAAIVITGLFFIIGNTIKLSIENRRQEIQVIKLVGGTDIYIARPFLYTGLLFGILGGSVAVFLQLIILIMLNGSLQELIQLYSSNFELRGFGFFNSLSLVITGALVGWLGAFLASFRYIRGVNP
ncbi:MAG TPA: cell division protein FtsX [Porticoccaceae bacterium]|jgi:cell division transport system permease protein|nr:cell division protein FtsX [Gammaproteobacteria bacterium]HIL61192.1 cell division protein FtsX [Porticoccaceae bacterium]